ncbi:MAG: response regulator transcription factor [Actinomycetales bacterium]|nr:response regulator transcription factor [Actinomycetales bacterium]
MTNYVGPRGIRAAFIEDETPVQRYLETLGNEDFRVIAGYPTVEDFCSARPEVDVVILDLWIRAAEDLPQPVRGHKALTALRRMGYRVLIYTSERRRFVLARLIRAGASGIVLKTEPDYVLPKAVVAVADGGVVLPMELTGFIELLQREQLLPSIGAQRLRVLQGRARGESNRSIAARLHVTEKAVENYTTLNNAAFAEFIRTVDLQGLDPAASSSAAAIAKMLGVGSGDLFDPDAPDLAT